jgi:hypothetical protein
MGTETELKSAVERNMMLKRMPNPVPAAWHKLYYPDEFSAHVNSPIRGEITFDFFRLELPGTNKVVGVGFTVVGKKRTDIWTASIVDPYVLFFAGTPSRPPYGSVGILFDLFPRQLRVTDEADIERFMRAWMGPLNAPGQRAGGIWTSYIRDRMQHPPEIPPTSATTAPAPSLKGTR